MGHPTTEIKFSSIAAPIINLMWKSDVEKMYPTHSAYVGFVKVQLTWEMNITRLFALLMLIGKPLVMFKLLNALTLFPLCQPGLLMLVAICVLSCLEHRIAN